MLPLWYSTCTGIHSLFASKEAASYKGYGSHSSFFSDLEGLPGVVEAADVLGELEEDLDGTDVVRVGLAVPREGRRDLASVVPDAAHDGLAGLVPQGDVL